MFKSSLCITTPSLLYIWIHILVFDVFVLQALCFYGSFGPVLTRLWWTTVLLRGSLGPYVAPTWPWLWVLWQQLLCLCSPCDFLFDQFLNINCNQPQKLEETCVCEHSAEKSTPPTGWVNTQWEKGDNPRGQTSYLSSLPPLYLRLPPFSLCPYVCWPGGATWTPKTPKQNQEIIKKRGDAAGRVWENILQWRSLFGKVTLKSNEVTTYSARINLNCFI